MLWKRSRLLEVSFLFGFGRGLDCWGCRSSRSVIGLVFHSFGLVKESPHNFWDSPKENNKTISLASSSPPLQAFSFFLKTMTSNQHTTNKLARGDTSGSFVEEVTDIEKATESIASVTLKRTKPFVALVACAAALGGLIFGYDIVSTGR